MDSEENPFHEMQLEPKRLKNEHVASINISKREEQKSLFKQTLISGRKLSETRNCIFESESISNFRQRDPEINSQVRGKACNSRFIEFHFFPLAKRNK